MTVEILQSGNKIYSMKFNGELESLYPYSDDSLKNHVFMALHIRDLKPKKLYSIILKRQPVHKDLSDNPKYVRKDVSIGPANIEKLPSDYLNKMPDVKEVIALLKDEGHWYAKPSNSREYSEEAIHDFRMSMVDDFYKSYQMSMLPSVIDSMRGELLTELALSDDGDEWLEVKDEEFDKAWETDKRRLCLPNLVCQRERVFTVSPPFGNWDERNYWQHFFIIECEKKTYYVVGGTATSGSRYNLGLMSYAYTSLAAFDESLIDTYILVYNEFNELVLRKKREGEYWCLDPVLGSNYQCSIQTDLHICTPHILEIDDV
jgi:hypothetical protein